MTAFKSILFLSYSVLFLPFQTSAQKSNSIFNSGDTSKVQEYYFFNHQIDLTIESIVEKDSALSKEEITMYFNNNNQYFGAKMKLESTNENYNVATSIFDWQNKMIVSLVDANGKKTGMTMARKWKGIESLENPYKVTKTGNITNILGYSCEEYFLENENATILIWITKHEFINLPQTFRYFSTDNKKAKSRKLMPEGMPDGLVLKSIYKCKNTRESHILTVQSVKEKEPVSILTKGYIFF